MPELVAGGPVIPIHLLNKIDSGQVVFFCGAGISMGPGSGLPGFADLVQHVYDANHLEPDDVEREALDLEEQNPKRRRPNFDKALGLLERPERLRRQVLRRTVIERLSEPPTGTLPVHEALLGLSRNGQGVRLVTTNFDNRFVEAGLEEHLIDVAPKLPVPKPYAWSSVVHLHGRILPDDDGSNLVLTAADFGRAYLTERWAARFITELFREFTVVFVGYSVSDPVMSYIVDALAAENARGARFATAYAFADHDGSDAGRWSARDGWLSKSVEPILYDGRHEHSQLTNTLKEWARIREDPFNARSQIAINGITKMPFSSDDPVVERVTWALQDPVAAKALASEPPIVNEEDFAKLERWLEMFTEKGLLCCAPTDANPGTGDHGSGVMRLVDHGFQSVNPDNLDMTRKYLAYWLARHLHVPQLFAWVLRNGGYLHPGLREEVERSLAAKDLNILPKLRFLWTVLLDNRPTGLRKQLWASDRYLIAASDSERRRIEDEAVESIAPRLIVRQGPSPRLLFCQDFDEGSRLIRLVDACGHLKLVSGGNDTWLRVEKILNDPRVLLRHAETFTGYLEQALALGVNDDDVYQDSSWYRPSISPHEQNRDDDNWIHLIDLVRDSYLALAVKERRRGENLLRCWVASDQGLFRRLAIHALTENAKADIRLARNLLLAGRKPGIWELEPRREVLRFFRLAGSRLPRSLRAEIVRAIHVGPKVKPRRTPPNYAEIIRREKSLLLYRLSVSGARLDKKSRMLAKEGKPDAEDDMERDEFLMWSYGARWVREEEYAPQDLLKGSVADVVAALEEGPIDPNRFRGLAFTKPVKVTSALRRLTKRGEWPPIYWQWFLGFLVGLRKQSKCSPRLQDHVARIIVAAPEQLFGKIGSAAGKFIERLAEEYDADREAEIRVIWTRAWTGREDSEPPVLGLNDPLTHALNHPAGKLAEAALMRLQKYKPQTGAGLPQAVRPYFDDIATDPDGHLGRVMLATELRYLYAIDPHWVTKYLIARLSPSQSTEAVNLWFAYSWSLTISPDLLFAFKEPFLEVLQDCGADDQRMGNLRRLFMEVCLEAPSELTAEEIHGVVAKMPEESLKTVLESLKRRLKGEPAERASIWREKVHPWLHAYWPREAARNTAGTSRMILDILVECGEAFPDAVNWSLEFLRPLDEHGLYHLNKSGHAKRHPDCMLQVLDRVVIADVFRDYQKYILQQILNDLTTVNADMAADERFRRLYQIAAS